MKKSPVVQILSLAGGEGGKITCAMLFAVIASALGFVPYYVLYRILTQLLGGGLALSSVLFWAAVAVGSACLKALFTSLAGVFSHTAAYNTMHKVKVRALEKLSALNLGFFTKHPVGQLKATLFDDVGRLESFIAHNLLEIAQSIAVPLILIICLLIIQPVMALCMLVPLALGIGIPMRMISAYPALTEEFAKTGAVLNGAVNEFIHGMPVIKMFGLTAEKFAGYKNALRAYMACMTKMCDIANKPLAITIVILDSGLLFTLPIGGWLYTNGALAAGTFLLFVLLSLCFYSAFYNVMNIMMSHMELSSGLESIREIMDTPPVVGGSKTLPKNGRYGIRFENVSFAYDGESGSEALQGVNLDIEPGSLTAFVGASGAGKTTAAQLIGRYWNTSGGILSIGGVPINELDTHSLMDLTAFVFQDVFLMEDTLFENIRMGGHTRERVEAAARAAQIHDFIAGLPDGYDTIIGEAGVKLSGGEKQRIAIARAILKDAPIIIFDEATSYADIENEHKIQLALNSLLQGKTTIMIAHRLHTILHADKIVVFDKGRIVEEGTHPQLVAQGGVYTRMWAAYADTMEAKEAV